MKSIFVIIIIFHTVCYGVEITTNSPANVVGSIIKRCGITPNEGTNNALNTVCVIEIEDRYYEGCVFIQTNCFQELSEYLKGYKLLHSNTAHRERDRIVKTYNSNSDGDISFHLSKEQNGETAFLWLCYNCLLEKYNDLLPDLPNEQGRLKEEHLTPSSEWTWVICAKESANVFCEFFIYYDNQCIGANTNYFRIYPDPQKWISQPNYGIVGYIEDDFEKGATYLEVVGTGFSSNGLKIEIEYVSDEIEGEGSLMEKLVLPMKPNYTFTQNDLRVDTHWGVVIDRSNYKLNEK